MVVERDVFVTMRDGVRVAVDIFRPDAPGEFPALYAASGYQKDLEYLPQWPVFHFRETNDIEWFVSRGYAYVHQDIRGSGQVGGGRVPALQPGGTERLLRHGRVDRRAALVHRQVGMIGESYLAWVQWFTAAMQPPHLELHRARSTPAPTCTGTWRSTAASWRSASRPTGGRRRSGPTTGWAGTGRGQRRATGTCRGT